MVRFVVFGLQRTGTSLVISLLQSHPDILSLGEIFANKLNRVSKGIPTFELYLKEANDAGEAVRSREEMRKRYLDDLFTEAKARAVGFKLMFNQIPRCPEVLDYFKEHRFKVIAIYRKNLIASAISHIRAMETGIYDCLQPAFKEIDPANKKIHIPERMLLSQLKAFTIENKGLRKTIKSLGLEGVELSYENLCSGWREEIRKVFTLLGVESQELHTRLEKVSPSRLEDSVENYEEIIAAVKNSPFSGYLEHNF